MSAPQVSLGILSRIQPGTKGALDKGGFSVVLYGASGSGKTTALGTLTSDPKKTLILYTERNLKSLFRTGCDYVHISTWAELQSTVQEVTQALRAKSFPYRAIAWDSITAAEPLTILGLTGKEIAALDSWKVIKARLRSLLNDILDWTNTEKFPQTVDVVITAGQDRTIVEHRETQQQLIGPDTPGKAIAPIFFRLCDCVFWSHCLDDFDPQTKTVVSKYIWRTKGNDQVEAKDGTNVMDLLMPQDFQELRRRLAAGLPKPPS